MSHADESRTADSLSPIAVIRRYFLSPLLLRTLLPGRMGLPRTVALGSLCFNKPQCIWRFSLLLPGARISTPHPIVRALSHFIVIVFPSESHNSLFCFIDLCLVQLTGGPISFTLIKGRNCSLSGKSPGLNKAPEVGIPGRKSVCQF